MGLDASLVYVMKISPDKADFLTGKYIGEMPYYYLNKDEIENDKYLYIRKKLTPVRGKFHSFDYDRLKKESGVSDEAGLWGIGPSYVRYREPDGREVQNHICWDDYKIVEDELVWVFESDDVYYWRNRHDIQDIIYEHYPNYINGKYVPITKEILEEIRAVDDDFARDYEYGDLHIYYTANW